MSFDYRQTLDDHQVLGSIGTVGDAYDNAMAESFVDSFKTELISDRVWQTWSQLELAIVEYIGWFNNDRLHESLGDRPPAEIEAEWAARTAFSGQLSVTVTSPRRAERLTTPRPDPDQVETGAQAWNQVEIDAEPPARNGLEDEPSPARTAPSLSIDESPQLVSLTLGS